MAAFFFPESKGSKSGFQHIRPRALRAEAVGNHYSQIFNWQFRSKGKCTDIGPCGGRAYGVSCLPCWRRSR